MKKFLIIIIIILVIGIALRLTLVKSRGSVSVEKTPISVEVVRVTRDDVKKTCSIVGMIIADKTIQVFPEAVGRVTKIFVREGNYVHKGDKIISLKNETVGFEFEEAFVTAPISGTIAKILVDIGSTVAPQVPVAMIVDVSRIKVNFNAPEIEAQCFRVNTPITIKLDAIPEKDFKGYISEISPVVDPITKTVGVKGVVESGGVSLKPGMTARISIKLNEKKGVIAVSQDALIDNTVFVVRQDSTAERRPVKIGLVGDDLVEITEGLNENEMVIVMGQQRLAGGEKVIPIVRAR
ncbi:MAG: efflux RND transporter periplasmic adaptor subunit [candidate division WOR-3 bacterium]|nr:efflux RND transporter periplasmic adaptor subunit [candidate division WOR-3 bacterium]